MLPSLAVVPDLVGLRFSQIHLVVSVPAQQLVHGALCECLHLLVDLPLHGVRGFPTAFVFRWPAFLHLWHSPGLVWILLGSEFG